MKAIIIFESLVIPAIITFMLIAVFLINRESIFRSNLNFNGKNKKNNTENKNFQKKIDNTNYLDFSGGMWGI